jgi:hypothetical protein
MAYNLGQLLGFLILVAIAVGVGREIYRKVKRSDQVE